MLTIDPSVMTARDIDFGLSELQAYFRESPEAYTAVIQHLRSLKRAVQAKKGPLTEEEHQSQVGNFGFPETDIDGWAVIIKRFAAIAESAMKSNRHGAALWFAHLTRFLAAEVAKHELRPNRD